MKTELDFLRERVGTQNWVVARRTSRITYRYGEDVVCLSPQKYAKIMSDYADYREDEMVRQIANDAGLDDAALSALKLAYQAGRSA